MVFPATFETDTDFTVPVFTIQNKKYYFEPTVSGIDLYEPGEEDSLGSKGHKITSLSYNNPNEPRFKFAQERVLTPGSLEIFSSAVLALMRNEIQAFHGWKFKKEEYKRYFEKQNWYKPSDTLSELSEVEKFNTSIIKLVEKRKQED